MEFTTENTLSSISRETYKVIARLIISHVRSKDAGSLHRAMALRNLLEKATTQYNQNQEADYLESLSNINVYLERDQINLNKRVSY